MVCGVWRKSWHNWDPLRPSTNTLPCLTDVVVAHIPIRAVSNVESRAILLHDNARYDVLEGLV